jgi:hypothetical protein
MGRIEDMERRLQNWARWKFGAGAGALGYARVNPATVLGADRSQIDEARIPTVDCEAEETNQAIVQLPSELRATVEVVYVGAGSMAQKARRLAVTPATVDQRVWRAHRLIQSWLADKALQRRRVRELTEARQQEARPQRKGEF